MEKKLKRKPLSRPVSVKAVRQAYYNCTNIISNSYRFVFETELLVSYRRTLPAS